MTRLIVLTPVEGADLERLHNALAPNAVEVVRSVAELGEALKQGDAVVLSFGTGEIVPASLLAGLRLPAYNLHASSPAFPGRDPHHHAIFRGAKEYGATLHRMMDAVDAGDIVAVESFSVPEGATPSSLLTMANDAAFRLLKRVAREFASPSPMPSLAGQSWGTAKTRRTDLYRLSTVSPLSTEDEFRRREKASASPGRQNLRTEILGRVFRHDPSAAPLAPDKRYAEFTEAGFAGLIDQLISGGYKFATYSERIAGRHVLWRHDVDASMHRSAKLARIEAARGVKATYFLNPRNTLYSLLDPAVEEQTRAIIAAGHDIGLHFDTCGYPRASWTLGDVESAVAEERRILEAIIRHPVVALSWHNPGTSNLLDFGGDEIGGLHNAYSTRLRADYVYCSDSNGYWRYRPMGEVIAEGAERLHLLTHPEWWTPEPMSPDDRIERALLGRARAVLRSNNEQLVRAGRKQKPDDAP